VVIVVVVILVELLVSQREGDIREKCVDGFRIQATQNKSQFRAGQRRADVELIDCTKVNRSRLSPSVGESRLDANVAHTRCYGG